MFYLRLFSLITLISFSQLALAQKIKKVQTKFEHGTLREGQRVGLWEFLDAKGGVELRINYDSGRIVFRQPDTARYLLRVGEQWQLVRPTRAPHPMGSRAGRAFELERNLHYPHRRLSRMQAGVVLISYIVGPDGHTSGHTLEQGLGLDYNEEVWQALRELPELWIPAVYLGQPTAAKFYLAVHFENSDGSNTQQYQEEAAKLEARHASLPQPPPYTDRILMGIITDYRR